VNPRLQTVGDGLAREGRSTAPSLRSGSITASPNSASADGPLLLSSAPDPSGLVRYSLPNRVVVNGESVSLEGQRTFASLADGGPLPASLIYEPGSRSFLVVGASALASPLKALVYVSTAAGEVVTVPVLIPRSGVTTPVIRGLW
jgi:hypothetical protein